jgi:hypothetical protein
MKPRDSLCAAARTQLGATADVTDLPGPLSSHAAECLRCQAEVSRTRRMHRALAHLGAELLAAPAGFAATVDATIDAPASEPTSHRLPQGTTVAAAAGALAAAGTLVVLGWMRARSAA